LEGKEGNRAFFSLPALVAVRHQWKRSAAKKMAESLKDKIVFRIRKNVISALTLT
jgi:hypothetical protein